MKIIGIKYRRKFEEGLRRLSDCVVPLFTADQRQRAVQYGSAVLLRLGDRRFLFTAEHVVADGRKAGGIFGDCGGKITALEGEFTVEKNFDLAVLELSPAQAQGFSAYEFLDVSQHLKRLAASPIRYAAVIGFPGTKAAPVWNQNSIKTQRYSMEGAALAPSARGRIYVKFDKKRNVDAQTRERITAPDPHGMSGGAIFGAAVKAAEIKVGVRPFLTGIATHWIRSQKRMEGTRLEIAMRLIEQG